VQIDAEPDGRQNPYGDADCASRSKPSPAALFYIGRPVIDGGEEEGNQGSHNHPAQRSDHRDDNASQKVVIDMLTRQSRNKIAGQHRRERSCDQHCQYDGDSNGRKASAKVRARFRNLIDKIEAPLDGGKSDRSRPERGHDTEGQLAARGG